MSIQTTKSKNYDGCPFKVKIPVINEYPDRLDFSISLIYTAGKSKNVVLDYIELEDKLHNKLRSGSLCIVSGLKNAASVELNKNTILKDAIITLSFIHETDGRIKVTYSLDNRSALTLQYIEKSISSETDRNRYMQIMSEYNEHHSKTKDGQIISSDGTQVKAVSHNKKKSLQLYIPTLDEYIKAVYREMYFLKEDGGSKFKVYKGELISKTVNGYIYSIELYTEVHIMDDSPITVIVGKNQGEGAVIMSDGLQLVALLESDLGERIDEAIINLSLWKLLEALNKKLESITSEDKIARKILDTRDALCKPDDHIRIAKGQDNAIRRALNSDITVIWGPPGTGKTYTMAKITTEYIRRSKSVLIVSHSNISVDGIAKKLSEMLHEENMIEHLCRGDVLRYGYVRDDQLASDQNVVSYNYTLRENAGLKRELEALENEKKQFIAKHGIQGFLNLREGKRIKERLGELHVKIREHERFYISKAQVVITTATKIYADSLFDSAHYDVVMFDEASMAYVPQIICAASYATSHFICVGDFNQLAPIAQSEAKAKLSIDIFSFLGISQNNKVCNHPWLVMLDTQRRMHPEISAFPNRAIYKNLLNDYPSLMNDRQNVVQSVPFNGSAINLLDITGTYCSAYKNSDNSRFNILSAILSFATALKAEKEGNCNTGIIAPYVAQARLIQAMILDYRRNHNTELACSTVHQFQGSERDVIIFDAVENYPSDRLGFLMSRDENRSVSRLINVAVTRAKGKLIVIAGKVFWGRMLDGKNHIFDKLIKHISENGNIVGPRDEVLAHYMQDFPDMGTIKYFIGIDRARRKFEEDIQYAREKIVVSIPSANLDRLSDDMVIDNINKAQKPGVRVTVQTAEYENLPEHWKKYAYASESARFPFIAVDDKVIWYGLPIPNGYLRGSPDKKGNASGTKILFSSIFRISGERTVKTIKLLTEYETRVFEGKKKSLLPKNVRATDKDEQDNVIDLYFNKRYSCTKCKKPMNLERSKKAKIYLRCPACRGMEYVTPDMLNLYIAKENVKCPTHKCGIKAYLSKFGLYIRCDRGHIIQPTEI